MIGFEGGRDGETKRRRGEEGEWWVFALAGVLVVRG